MARYCLMVVCNPEPGMEDEFNSWYNNQHLNDVLRVPGFVSAQRYKVTHDSALPGQYVAMYEMETDDPQAVMMELEKRVGTPEMPFTAALDLSKASLTICAALTERVVAK